MSIGAALIQGGFGLLGGMMGKKANPGRDTRHVILNQVGTAREAGERFGFNPLTVLGATGGTVAPGGSDPNYMGQAIADAGMLLADAWSKRTDAQKLQRSQERIKELQTQLDHQTIRPKVGGVYAQREMSPMMRPSSGGANGTASSGAVQAQSVRGAGNSVAAGDLRPLGETDVGSIVSDPRRELDHDKVKTHSGYIMIDNPNLPFPVRVPTLDGDEPVQWYDLPTLAIPGALAGVDFLNSPAFGPPEGYTSDGERIDGSPKLSKFKRPKLRPAGRPKMAGGKVASPKSSAGKLPFQP